MEIGPSASHSARLTQPRRPSEAATRRRTGLAALLALGSGSWCPPVLATIPVDGQFVAVQECPATLAIKRRDPADGTRLEPGRRYPVVGKNRADATHYLVIVEGARAPQRWVEAGCGTLALAADRGAHPAPDRTRPGASDPGRVGAAPTATEVKAATRPPGPKAGSFILALSWQPAFCEVNRRKAECRDQTPGRPDASGFSLHGLWPQPRDNAYCGVDARTRELDREGNWTALPTPALRPATRERLAALMPGVRSGLDRHEWINHGTCYGTDAETYFAHALDLLDQVNASPVRDLFAANRGKHLSSSQIRAAFDTAFGRGSGERVRLVCAEGMIGELRLSLKGETGDGARIAQLMQAAPMLSPRCRGGRVDEAGFQ